MRSVVIIVLCFLFFSCKKKQEKTEVTVQSITESVYASGTVKSVNQYQVFSTVSGIIKNIFITEGDVVHKGQPLISILNEASQLSTQNAALAAEYSSEAANANKLRELETNIELAKTKMQTDSTLLERQRNLWSQQIGTRNELDQRELAYKSSVAAYKAAIYRYSDLKKQLQFAARQSQKNLQISSTQSSDYTVKSEAAGKVYKLLKEKGEMVNQQTPVAIIGAANAFILELQVDEYDISKLRLGQKVLVNMDSYKGQTFEATVSKIDPIMNERSRSFTVEATFNSMPQVLYPNLTAEANIIIQTKQNALLIPRAYLVNDSLVVLPNGENRKVSTGLKDYQKVEITGGLKKGDVIVKPAE